jgi:general secretion pathway protein E
MRYPLPYAFARDHGLLLEDDGQQLSLWVSPDSQRQALSEVTRHYTHLHPELPLNRLTQDPDGLRQRIQEAYSGSQAQGGSSAADVVNAVESEADLSRMMQELPAVEDLLEASDDAPIIRMLNALLTQATRDGASDIHIEPYERHSSVRFRIDGGLREVVQPNRALHAALISRLKIMAELDIAEKRLPQDGRISLRLGSRAVDVRVSTLPSAHGERAVLRLLDKSEARLTLEAVGMQGRVLQQVDQLIAQPHGILLVTGPTGSGKTTSLYAALQRLDASRSNIMTVEDPIEYELPGVGQTQVNAKIDLTFASAVTRLTDMGVEPFLLSSSLLGVLAQRLVRKRCTDCGGAGCTHCGHTGYAGRTGIFELLVANDEIRSQIHNRAAESELRATALAQGMVLMRDDGQRLVDAGITGAEELLRVTRD